MFGSINALRAIYIARVQCYRERERDSVYERERSGFNDITRDERVGFERSRPFSRTSAACVKITSSTADMGKLIELERFALVC